MGAREELLAAARDLADRGLVPFSPADLIRAVYRGGSKYPESTLRTYIVGPMCINSPDNHAVQYGDLERVGRGQYVLAEGRGWREAAASEPPSPQSQDDVAAPERTDSASSVTSIEATEEWFWEGNVQAAVVAHLAAEGWRIHRVADTAASEHGIDIEARRGDRRLLVEVKGYPSSVYVRGAKRGQRKPTQPALQARHYFSHALLSGLLMRSESASAAVALAFPDFQTYRTLAERTRPALRSAGIDVWLVHENGSVDDAPGNWPSDD